jgi:hypothetical protein
MVDDGGRRNDHPEVNQNKDVVRRFVIDAKALA